MESDNAPANLPSGQYDPNLPPASNISPQPAGRARWLYFLLAGIILLLTLGGIYWLFNSSSRSSSELSNTSQAARSQKQPPTSVQGLELIKDKNYGDKYSNGILPVGDDKYVTDSPKQGYVYVCSNYAKNMQSAQGGAGRRGPWFVSTTQYDLNKKAHVQGSVKWQAQFSSGIVGANRTIITNNLPDHKTGVFPISSADPAYAYDRNPNSIKGQTFKYELDASPEYQSPSCIGGQVGVMLTGVALFNGFDAAGRDAGAWEVQDSCNGHPEKQGIYHYHTLSSCIKDINVQTVIGFALDGFPITGPKVGEKNILTSSDLDECHGITSQIVLNGKNVTTYHYVMTQDFPYSVSCYRGQAIQPPGQQIAGSRP